MEKPKVLRFITETDLEPLKRSIMDLPFGDLVVLVQWMKKEGILTVNQEIRVSNPTIQ